VGKESMKGIFSIIKAGNYKIKKYVTWKVVAMETSITDSYLCGGVLALRITDVPRINERRPTLLLFNHTPKCGQF